MLTREIITSSQVLAGLTEEQLSAIETLSRNDEEQTMGQRFGEVYRQMDETILNATGIRRDGAEKTYRYLSRAMEQVKGQLSDHEQLKADIDSLRAEKERLEKSLAEGGGDVSAREIARLQAEVESTMAKYKDLEKKHKEAELRHEKELLDTKVGADIESAMSGMKFRKGISDSVLSVLKAQVSREILGMNPGYEDDGKGGRRLMFHDEKGAVLRNQSNSLNPYTAAELVESKFRDMDILDTGFRQTGAGSHGGQDRRTADTVDLSGARTKSEAYEMLVGALTAKGMKIGSAEFEEAVGEAWKSFKVSELPQ